MTIIENDNDRPALAGDGARALEEMRTQLTAFLADPEGYDRQREMCDRVALARACLAELDAVKELRVTIDIIGALAADVITRHGISHLPPSLPGAVD